MPFTLSHAAAALPFRKFKPIWPALVIGTFAPDLQYFILLSDEDRSGHHYPDVLLFTLPVALLVLWLFEWAVKEPAIGLLPSGWQRRLQDKVAPLSFWGWRPFARIVVWIAAGTLTHLIWDQFTHSNTRTASYLPVLKAHVTPPFWHSMTVAGFLQNSSTILGLLAICLWCAAWYRRTPPSPKTLASELAPLTKLCVTSFMGLAALLTGGVLAWSIVSDHLGPISRSTRVAITVMAMTQVFCVEMLIYGATMTLRSRFRQIAAPQIRESTPRS
jgi:hypothetical protein